jgi:hypothetical protein
LWHFGSHHRCTHCVYVHTSCPGGGGCGARARSGGAGPVSVVQRELAVRHGLDTTHVLTDLYPHPDAWRVISSKNPCVTYQTESVDATSTGAAGGAGFRTLYACFHHFGPVMARAILQDAINTNSGIAVYELTERSIVAILFYGLIIGLSVGIACFFFTPFNLTVVFFCTLCPVGQLVAVWDGVVSCLRSYTVEVRLRTRSRG